MLLHFLHRHRQEATTQCRIHMDGVVSTKAVRTHYRTTIVTAAWLIATHIVKTYAIAQDDLSCMPE